MERAKIFLSHAAEDRITARRLVEGLAEHGFDVFRVDDDLVLKKDGENTVKDLIEKCILFVALLSENFKNSDFTDHEVGIAIACNKKIFPVSLDHVTPYGFMFGLGDSQKIDPKIDPDEMSVLARAMRSLLDKDRKAIDRLIEVMRCADSVEDAGMAAYVLFEHTAFSPKQINGVAVAFLENDNISDSWMAEPICLAFLNSNWDLIDPRYRDELSQMHPDLGHS